MCVRPRLPIVVVVVIVVVGTELLTGVGSRLPILFVVAQKINIVLDVGGAKIGDLEVRPPDGLRIASNILHAGQSAKVTPFWYFVPRNRLRLFLRDGLARQQTAHVISAAHTFRHDLL